MLHAVLILGGLLILITIKHILYRRQISDFCRQLAFIKDHTTNMTMTQSVDSNELTRLTDAMNELLQSYRRIVIDTRDKDERLKAAITNVSHDIRTPLTSLDGYFQLLLSAEDNDERMRYYNIISERIASLSELLEQLFTYTKLQNNAYNLELDRVNVSEVLSATLLSFYDDITACGITPDINIGEENVLVLGNEVALRRVFQNIIKNALAHGTDFFAVTLTADDDAVKISFSNSYTGAEGEIDVSQVFDRFYKADASRSDKTTGLGLSIAKELMTRMDGEITASYEKRVFGVFLGLKRVKI